MSNQLNKNILATVIYYSGLDYPLTAFEIWKYLIRTDYYANNNQIAQISLFEVMRQLQDSNLSAFMESKNGFYFLKGQDYLIKKRIGNNKISKSKLDSLVNISKWLRLVPFVKMVGITGALAMKNAKAKSDLDIFVVCKHGKIWTGRTLVTLFLHVFKKRRHGKRIANRACLNFFVTDQSLEVITKDLFSANEYMFLFPVYGWATYLRFQIKNQWIKNMKPEYALSEIPPLKIISDSYLTTGVRRIGEILLFADWIEKILKKIEKRKIMQNPKTHQEGSLVYANDDALVFLPDPHGPKVFQHFKEKISDLSI